MCCWSLKFLSPPLLSTLPVAPLDSSSSCTSLGTAARQQPTMAAFMAARIVAMRCSFRARCHLEYSSESMSLVSCRGFGATAMRERATSSRLPINATSASARLMPSSRGFNNASPCCDATLPSSCATLSARLPATSARPARMAWHVKKNAAALVCIRCAKVRSSRIWSSYASSVCSLVFFWVRCTVVADARPMTLLPGPTRRPGAPPLSELETLLSANSLEALRNNDASWSRCMKMRLRRMEALKAGGDGAAASAAAVLTVATGKALGAATSWQSSGATFKTNRDPEEGWADVKLNITAAQPQRSTALSA
mmetsp:Transcript_112712/g.224198  ORF Transcript_112712/g.224198 Transcript_112712/m.224198 type:complete len:310 (+) Transcript_112712:290-1219(+)